MSNTWSHAKPLASPNMSTAALGPNPTLPSDLKIWSANNTELSGSDVLSETGKKSMGANEGTLTDLFIHL